MKLYTSDTHLSHTNVIEFSRRPFNSVAHMDAECVRELRLAEDRIEEAGGGLLIHCGDLCFNYARFVEQHGKLFRSPDHKLLKVGNHDPVHSPRNNKSKNSRQVAAYLGDFAQVIGTIGGWEHEGIVIQDELDGKTVSVLVSHAPIEHMWDCDINVHGHLHNDILLQEPHRDGYEWSFNSPTHFNAGVELHGFKPVTLQELADAHRSNYGVARADLAARGVPNVRGNPKEEESPYAP